MGFICDPCLNAHKYGWWGPDHKGTHCRGCHRSWTALKESHCPECHQSFSADSLADRHRVGGRCLTGEKLSVLETRSGRLVMRLVDGVWRYPERLTRISEAVIA